jgi:hypothetical protein
MRIHTVSVIHFHVFNKLQLDNGSTAALHFCTCQQKTASFAYPCTPYIQLHSRLADGQHHRSNSMQMLKHVARILSVGRFKLGIPNVIPSLKITN